MRAACGGPPAHALRSYSMGGQTAERINQVLRTHGTMRACCAAWAQAQRAAAERGHCRPCTDGLRGKRSAPSQAEDVGCMQRGGRLLLLPLLAACATGGAPQRRERPRPC